MAIPIGKLHERNFTLDQTSAVWKTQLMLLQSCGNRDIVKSIKAMQCKEYKCNAMHAEYNNQFCFCFSGIVIL